MRTVQVTKHLENFSNLSEKDQNSIIEKIREMDVSNDFWYEYVLDYWKEQLEKCGFEDADIRFSGFWSQGDGASFTAICDPQIIMNTLFLLNEKTASANLKKWRLWFEMVENGPYIYFRIERETSRYSHKHTISAYMVEDFAGFTNKVFQDERGNWTSVFDQKLQLQELSLMFEGFVMDICDKIYDNLEQAYNYLTSDDYIRQMLLDFDEEFCVDENGDLL